MAFVQILTKLVMQVESHLGSIPPSPPPPPPYGLERLYCSRSLSRNKVNNIITMLHASRGNTEILLRTLALTDQSWSSNEIANTPRKQIYLNNNIRVLHLMIKNLLKFTFNITPRYGYFFVRNLTSNQLIELPQGVFDNNTRLRHL